MTRLFLLFTVVPAVELYLLMTLGSMFGPAATLAVIVVTGILGAGLARQEGFNVLQRLASDVQQGQAPTQGLAEGALVAAGGLLLVTPGVLTDLVGFSLVIPLTRRILAQRLLAWAAANITMQGLNVDLGQAAGYRAGPQAAPEAAHRGAPPSDPAPQTPFEHPVS